MTSGKYFNRGVMALNLPHLGYVVRETVDKIIVFGEKNNRYDIPKSRMIAIGRNVILDMDFPEVFKYQINRDAPFPSDELKEKLAH